ncbi:MAG: phosphatidylserine decarboxylase family protein [Methylocystaceae bacterium]
MSAVSIRETSNRNRIAREGKIFITAGLLASTAAYYLVMNWFWLPLTLTLFTGFFFRNPRRTIPDSEGLVVSPADGRVMRIENVNEDNYLMSSAVRVTIFMSLFNVHVNRMPVKGRVEKVVRKTGDYLPAYRPEAPEKNVTCYTLINTQWGRILIAQITGAVARRLVCYASPGREFETGQLFGLIKFGSCVQLYLPPEVYLTIKIGDKVRGGETEIGRF